jgi:type 2 lantibiotic biosynthesis protein LanM
LLGPARLADDQPLPVWAERLNALLQFCDSSIDTHQHNWVLPLADWAEKSLPFWEVWLPLVTGATDELRRQARKSLDNLTEDALRSFQAQLLSMLSYVAGLPLGLEFRRFLAKNDPLSVFRPPASDGSPPPRDLYRSFVGHLRSEGLLTFFQEYAVLARLMSEVAGHWADQVAEFCRRIDEDRTELARLFHRGLELGPVVQVRLGLSDPHNGRRDVIIPMFASGVKLVYKPKDLGIDQAFWTLINWLNSRAQSEEALPLRTLTLLNRTTHGWVEFVEHRACQNAKEVERYYRRIGMLLCLAYVLGGSDFHRENMIADGEQPLLLDLETMLQPLPRSWDGLRTASADQRVLEIMHDSVWRTGLLPFWIIGNPGKSYDVSGIGAEEASDTGYLDVHWENINTDHMQLVYQSSKTDLKENRPLLDGHVISAEDHVAEMTSGFTDMYRVLLARRDELLAEDGPLSLFRGLKLRCLLRMTKAYAQIFNRRLHPEFLRDGADSSIELERLARDFVVVHPDLESPPPWGIYGAEVEALERLDIPFFSFFSDSDALRADGRVVAPGYFSESGLKRVASCLRKLGEEDLRAQTDFLHASLHARYYTHRQSEIAHAEAAVGVAESSTPPMTRPEFIAAAVAIANQIRARAIHGADGGVTWISLAFDPSVDRMNFLPMADDLYDGRIGVSFFLAALEKLTGGAGFRDLALAGLLQLRKSLRQPIPPLTARTTLGGAAGLGSQLYALVRIAGWLDDDELLHLATRAAAWFVPKRIARDEALDVFGGAAGGILGLLTLSAAGSNGNALNPAVQCGDHLLKKRVPTETGHRAWPATWVPRPLTGFGHGAAGISYALLHLSQASGESRFREAAEEGIAYEAAVYSAGTRNWPDLRYANAQDGHRYMVAWCNGAAGIGLGRLGGLPLLDTPAIRQDIANALQTTRATPLSDEDHVCCGNLGRLDLLVEASRRLDCPEALDHARRSAGMLVRRAARRGGYGLYAQVPEVADSLSLFQGTAGIGYELLRLAEPDQMPCILLWE